MKFNEAIGYVAAILFFISAFMSIGDRGMFFDLGTLAVLSMIYAEVSK